MFNKNLPEINDLINMINYDELLLQIAHISRYKLSMTENPKKYVSEMMKNFKTNENIVITEVVVFEEDAYLNSLAFLMDNNHRRFFTVKELIEMFEETARLEFFINIKKEIDFHKIIESHNKEMTVKIIKHFNSMPQNIKDYMKVKEENNIIKSFNLNIGFFIISKK